MADREWPADQGREAQGQSLAVEVGEEKEEQDNQVVQQLEWLHRAAHNMGIVCAWWIAWRCPELLRYIPNILIIFGSFPFSSGLLFLTLFSFRIPLDSSASMSPFLVDLSVMS